MSSPLDLSTELLFHICTFVDCDDLKTFSATCHRIHLVAEPLLFKHRRLWSKFESFTEDDETGQWFWHNLTISLLTTSPGAPYIRHITTGALDRLEQNPWRNNRSSRTVLKDWDIHSDSWTWRPYIPPSTRRINTFADRPVKPSAEQLAILTKEAKTREWPTEGQRNELSNGLRSGKQGFIRALLLPLLPNLRTLKIESSASSQQHDLEAAVLHAAVAHSLHLRCPLFAKLTTVDFTSDESSENGFSRNGAGKYTFEFLSAFMSLPKIKKVSASLVQEEIFTRDWALPPPKATNICFYESDISSEAFESLLEGGAPLEKISIGVKSNGLFFDDGEFGEVLLKTSQHSLEKIELLRKSDLNLHKHGIRLQAFSKLKIVNINYESFRLQDSDLLKDVLPFSLEKLTLHTIRHWIDMPTQLLILLRDKERFACWVELTVYAWLAKDVERALMAACREKGVTWISTGTSEGSLRIADPWSWSRH